MNSEHRSGKILFVCSYNAIRSPMAAAMLNHLAQGALEADSAGLFTEGGHPMTHEVMAEVSPAADAALAHHQPKSWQSIEPAAIELVIVLSTEANRYAGALAERFGCPVEYWPTTDPTQTEGNHEQRLMAFRMVREEITTKLKNRFTQCKL